MKKKIFTNATDAEFAANSLVGWGEVEVVEVDLWEDKPAYVIKIGGYKYLRINGYIE